MRLILRGSSSREECSAICDGTNLRQRLGSLVFEREAPLNFATSILNVLASKGFTTGAAWSADGKTDSDPKFKLSNFRFSRDEQGSTVIAYVLEQKEYVRRNRGFSEERVFYDVLLWYDPKTYLPVRRTLKCKSRGDTSSFVETFNGFDLEADIPDARFRLSREY